MGTIKLICSRNPKPMKLRFDKIRMLTICVGLSVLAHLLLLFPLGKLGSYNFARPVNPLQAVMVDLARTGDDVVADKESGHTSDTASAAGDAEDESSHVPMGGESFDAPLQEGRWAVPVTAADENVPGTDKADSLQNNVSNSETTPAASRKNSPVYVIQPPLRTASEFLATEREKLTYQISMFGLPVGIAELEAKNERGEVRITLKVKSNSVLSSLYPVDDLVETRHIGGNFILTRIRQQEGSFRSDRGFTIMLREKKVFWIDRLKNRSTTEPIPNGEVLDIISGLYYLRNRPLQVGKTELLQVFDSDTYTPLPVEVLRREQVRLPGFRKADTIVIKPLLKTDGIFKRTGDVTIWLTDDDFRAPVKVETQVPLGKVTAELLSAETQR
ncbi:hypothetical protein Gura_0990 [Geotalea uraniireducens Rf4]|uniref:DUF3108 domain-containing protein n=2 Tax=Geotalea uraniireducens TaxID=351604 RepID=A5GB59_GEOUR|nr:hypothetical protein Gura_0990 [Geotalea uraniireducens Rf4]